MGNGDVAGDGRGTAVRDAPSIADGALDRETADSPAAETTLAPDDVFHLLQTSRRRDVLVELRESDGAVDVRTLSERIAADEHETTVDALDSAQRQRVYISLYQTHLPKLDECGVIDYDKDRGVVSRRPEADELDPHLELAADPSRAETPWPRRYVAVATLGLVAFVATTVVSTPLPERGVAVAVVAAVGLTALVHDRTVE